jgi:hypothetical protein
MRSRGKAGTAAEEMMSPCLKSLEARVMAAAVSSATRVARAMVLSIVVKSPSLIPAATA